MFHGALTDKIILFQLVIKFGPFKGNGTPIKISNGLSTQLISINLCHINFHLPMRLQHEEIGRYFGGFEDSALSKASARVRRASPFPTRIAWESGEIILSGKRHKTS